VTTISESILIQRPPDDVFDFVTDPTKTALWQTTVDESRQVTPGPMAVGTRTTDVRRFLGRRIESQWEVVEHDPPRRSAVRGVSGPIPFTGTYTLEPVEGGATRFTSSVELDAHGFFKLAEPIFAGIARREVRSNLGHLKDLLEAGADAGPETRP
jgi:carbon monoxide dehydrogenase subunit G